MDWDTPLSQPHPTWRSPVVLSHVVMLHVRQNKIDKPAPIILPQTVSDSLMRRMWYDLLAS